MKKQFKFMLVALMTLLTTGAWAQDLKLEAGQTTTDGNFKFIITAADDPAANPNKTTLDAEATFAGYVDETLAVNDAGAIQLPSGFNVTVSSKTWAVKVTAIQDKAWDAENKQFKENEAVQILTPNANNRLAYAASVVIPASYKAIPSHCFDGCSNLSSITFATGSNVRSIGKYAFATTQITDFDFSPCTKLTELPDEVFVEKGGNRKNTFIKTVTIPNSPYFQHINGAFRNLTALTTINNLATGYVTEIIGKSFSGCDALTALSLGGDLNYIAYNALEGSKIATLSIDVTNIIAIGGYTIDAAQDKATANYQLAENNQKNLYQTDKDENLTSLTLTGELKGKIFPYAFKSCENLATLDFDIDNATNPFKFGSTGQIKNNAFEGCKKIEVLTFGDILDNSMNENQAEATEYTIATEAFKGCSALYNVSFGNISASYAIAGSAFENTYATEKKINGNAVGILTIGNISGSNVIAADAFKTCKYLNKVTIGNISGAQAIAGSAFNTCENLAEVKIGNISATEAIAANAFTTVKALTTVTIGEVTAANAIGAAAFGKNLKTVTIGMVKANGAAFAGATAAQVAADAVYSFTSWSAATDGTQWAEGTASVADTETEGVKKVTVLTNTSANENVSADEAAAFVNNTYYINSTEGRIQLFSDANCQTSANLWIQAELQTPAVEAQEATDATFVWGDNSGSTLTLAHGTYLSSDDATTIILPAGTFDMSAIKNSGNKSNFVWPVVTIGEVRSLGGVFADGTFVNPKQYQSVTFEGAIAANGINAHPFGSADAATTIATLTFNETIGTAGIGVAAFKNLKTTNNITFKKLLAKFAVADEAFALLNEPAEAAAATAAVPYATVDYQATDIRNWADNPFSVWAFTVKTGDNAYSEDAFALKRVIKLIVADTNLKKCFFDTKNDAGEVTEEAEEGIGKLYNGRFEIYRVIFEDAAAEDELMGTHFYLYRDNNDKKMAWGRFDGQFVKNFNLNEATATREQIAENTINSQMEITRYQKVKVGSTEYDAKLTLYAVYTDSDAVEKVSTVYMVPLHVYDGKYYINSVAQDGNKQIIIAKAELKSGEAQFGTAENGQVNVICSYVVPENNTKNSVWEGLPERNYNSMKQFNKQNANWTNQQMWDARDGAPDIWGGKAATIAATTNTAAEAEIAAGKTLEQRNVCAWEAIYIMSNPAKYNGFRIDKNCVKKGGAFIAKGWYTAILPHYATKVTEETAAARVMWMDYDQTTSIFGVTEKVVNNAKSAAIYNLQGVRVSAPVKGQIYIQNGKKFMAK